jgi:hypothetical protein
MRNEMKSCESGMTFEGFLKPLFEDCRFGVPMRAVSVVHVLATIGPSPSLPRIHHGLRACR